MLLALSIMAALGVLGAGAVLFRQGMRARPIDNHPICAACRFDLVDLFPLVDRCPECGARLAAWGALLPGRRRRNLLCVVIGASLMLSVVAATSALGIGAASGFELSTIKPDWWLVMDARHGDPPSAAAALRRLTDRLQRGELSQTHIDQLIADALAQQADDRFAWVRDWGDFFTAAAAAGHVDQRQHAQFARNAVIATLETPDRVRANSPLECSLNLHLSRAGSNTRYWCRPTRASFEIAETVVADEKLDANLELISRGTATATVAIRPSLSPGPMELTGHFVLELRADPFDQGKPLAVLSIERTTRFDVVADAEPAIPARGRTPDPIDSNREYPQTPQRR